MSSVCEYGSEAKSNTAVRVHTGPAKLVSLEHIARLLRKFTNGRLP